MSSGHTAHPPPQRGETVAHVVGWAARRVPVHRPDAQRRYHVANRDLPCRPGQAIAGVTAALVHDQPLAAHRAEDAAT